MTDPSDEPVKTVRLCTWVLPDDDKQIRQDAKNARLSVSAYMRTRLLDKPDPTTDPAHVRNLAHKPTRKAVR